MNGAARLEVALRARKGLIIYVTCGDPTLADTVDIVCACARGGADVVELGVPFSDPSADGPVIQKAMARALEQGASLKTVLATTTAVREKGVTLPIVLFGYYNPFFVYGAERFASHAATAGVDGVLVVDLPPEEAREFHVPVRNEGLATIPLVAPTSNRERLQRIARAASGFVYYVSMTGVTGANLGELARATIEPRLAEIRSYTKLPIAVGFGVATPSDAAELARYADAVVVGSAVVRQIETSPQGRAASTVETYVRSLREALDG